MIGFFAIFGALVLTWELERSVVDKVKEPIEIGSNASQLAYRFTGKYTQPRSDS